MSTDPARYQEVESRSVQTIVRSVMLCQRIRPVIKSLNREASRPLCQSDLVWADYRLVTGRCMPFHSPPNLLPLADYRLVTGRCMRQDQPG